MAVIGGYTDEWMGLTSGMYRKKGEGKVLEILVGVERGTRREMEQARLALCRLRAEARQEPLNHPVRLVPVVINDLRPVVHVDLLHPPDEQLQLVLVEHAQQV